MKRALCVAAALLAALAICAAGAPRRAAAGAAPDVTGYIAQLLEWKRVQLGSSGPILTGALLEQAGTTGADWYPVGLGRYGAEDDYAAYLAAVDAEVQRRYSTSGKLHAAKATEWHRIALAVLASGGNPRRMGRSGDIDLIADGVYNRVDAGGKGILEKQGVNGLIWGLIALDSLRYAVPVGAAYGRGDIIAGILRRQQEDGGFALSRGESDPDLTAMAVQALAGYYNSEVEFTYTGLYREGTVTRKVRDVVDEALGLLSGVQNANGTFSSWGVESCESCVQVLVALTALGIDPAQDARFIKNGNTVTDGLLRFRNADGGFSHADVYDAENPNAVPGESNSMAGEQALYAMTALWRAQRGMRRLYDFRLERTPVQVEAQADAENRIAALRDGADPQEVAEAYKAYLAIDESERSYVRGYARLSGYLAAAGIPYAEEDLTAGTDAGNEDGYLAEFTQADREETDALPETLTTFYGQRVERLWYKVHHCFDFEGKAAYVRKLDSARLAIADISAEIAAINALMRETLYPLERIGAGDRKAVYALLNRYYALSEYDRTGVEHAEDLLKGAARADNLTLALWLGVAGGAALVGAVLFVWLHVKARRRRRQACAMPESEE